VNRIVTGHDSMEDIAMTDALRTGKPATPWHLWLVGGLLALWNAFGSFDFTATATGTAAQVR